MTDLTEKNLEATLLNLTKTGKPIKIKPTSMSVAYNLHMQKLREEFPTGIPFVTQDELERLRRETE